MRKLALLAILGLPSGFAAPAAHAVPFTATLTITVGALDPIVWDASGFGASEPSGIARLPAGSLSFGMVMRLPEPSFPFPPGFAICTPGVAGGTPVALPSSPGDPALDCAPQPNGTNQEIVFDGDTTAVGGLVASAYFTTALIFSSTEIPMAVIGNGGSAAFDLFGIPGDLHGNRWTTGSVSVTGVNPAITLSAMGVDARDAAGLGQLKLVTTALADVTPNDQLAVLAVLDIAFVPEPGTTALLAVGLASLAAQRRLRR